MRLGTFLEKRWWWICLAVAFVVGSFARLTLIGFAPLTSQWAFAQSESTIPSTSPIPVEEMARYLSSHGVKASVDVPSASVTTITFSEFPIGTRVADQYVPLGVAFSGSGAGPFYLA